MEWRHININKQNIETETDKAVLIKMPHNSDYDGYMFWYPKKFIRNGQNSNAIDLSYGYDFDFNLFKCGKGKYNSRDVVARTAIGTFSFEEAFHEMDSNISSHTLKDSYETHKPETVEAVKTQIQEELKDYE